MAQQNIRSSHDFVINFLELESFDNKIYDISLHLVEYTYEESLFHPFLHGTILFLDSVDYSGYLPIIGEERIKSSFTRPDENSKSGELLDPIEFDLSVYTCRGKTVQSFGAGKTQSYFLKYISDGKIENHGKKVFKKFRNMKYSEMVQKIHQEFLSSDGSTIEIEETYGEYSFFIQNLSPFEAIKRIAQRSVSNENNGYNYVFYRDSEGYKFKTLSSLASQEPVLTVSYSPKNFQNSINSDLYSVSSYEDLTEIDTLNSITSGEITSSLLTVDPVRRKFYLNASDLRGDAGTAIHNYPVLKNSKWEDFPHMRDSKPYIETSKKFVNPIANLHTLITDFGHKDTEYISQRDNDIYISEPEEYYSQKRSHFSQMHSNVMKITLSGHPDVKAGSVIKFNLPEVSGTSTKEKQSELDKYLQGHYLVTEVAHILKTDGYKMNIKMIKDSLFTDIEARELNKFSQ